DAPSEVLDHLVAFASPILDARGFEPNWLLNPVTMALFNEAFFHKQARGETLGVTGYTPYFFPLDAIRNWNRLYGSRGMLQYQLVVPHDPEHRAIEDVLKRVSSSGMASFLAVIKEFGDDCHSGLSFPSPGVTLALDFPNVGDKLLTLLNELDAVVLDAGGRIYLGKDARVSQDSFRKMYPQWETWREVRDRWDPKQVFQSELGRRLGLVG
ncbi:MAG: decaprenylphospho-beta-D-ribofuranose 2-oxidase, partial [Myxococcota bacterium]